MTYQPDFTDRTTDDLRRELDLIEREADTLSQSDWRDVAENRAAWRAVDDELRRRGA